MLRSAVPFLIVLACAPATTTTQSPGYATTTASCEQLCVHVLGCQGEDVEARLGECQTECYARGMTQDQIAAVLAMSCEQIAASQAGGATDDEGAGQSGTACTADCTGCVGDGTSCYHGTGLACDACCCAPGGPSPVWQ